VDELLLEEIREVEMEKKLALPDSPPINAEGNVVI
jgi:hypothetical protein